MRNSPFWWVLLTLMFLLDLYVFQVLKYVSHTAMPRTKTIIYSIYWLISISAIVFLAVLPYLHFDQQPKILRNTIFAIIAGLFFAKIAASVFFLADATLLRADAVLRARPALRRMLTAFRRVAFRFVAFRLAPFAISVTSFLRPIRSELTLTVVR